VGSFHMGVLMEVFSPPVAGASVELVRFVLGSFLLLDLDVQISLYILKLDWMRSLW
jgi:hypothetical protein